MTATATDIALIKALQPGPRPPDYPTWWEIHMEKGTPILRGLSEALHAEYMRPCDQ